MDERITVYPQGQRAGVVLTPADHLATGGEGAVYAKAGRIYKVYLDPAKAAANGIAHKLPLLRQLVHPGIAAPEALLLDKDGQPIGLTLPQVPGVPLYKAFTNAWRDANGFAEPQTIRVADAMREVVQFVHERKALIVDGNELNWLFEGERPVAIDVDSWQLPGYPATVIMPSIRDHSVDAFTEGTDWFAWGVVTFQLFTGIHPYKGTHPAFGRGALEERMKARASVFDAGVRLPGTARGIPAIPLRLRDWYARTFSTAERSAPPQAAGSGIAVQTAPRLKVIQGSTATLEIERIASLPGPVAAGMNGFLVLRLLHGLALWDTTARAPVPVPQEALSAVLAGRGVLLRAPGARVVVTVEPAVQQVRALDLDSGETARLQTAGTRLWQARNRAFVLAEGTPNGLHELDVAYWKQGDRDHLMLSQKMQWPVSVLSATFGRNVLVQDVLGTPIIGVMTGDGIVQGVAKGLQGYRVADGFAADEHNVWLAATRMRDGEQVRLRLSFAIDRFEIDDEQVGDELGIDAAATDAGVGVLRAGDELLAVRGTSRRRIACTGMTATLRLFGAGSQIAAFDGREVVKVSVR